MLHRLDRADRWQCIHFVPADQHARLAALDQQGFYVAEVEAESLASSDDLFDALGTAYRFPGDFGRNWDALIDYLGDLTWINPAKVLLIIDGSSGIELNKTLGHLVEIWLAVAQEWSDQGVPFHLAIVGPWA